MAVVGNGNGDDSVRRLKLRKGELPSDVELLSEGGLPSDGELPSDGKLPSDGELPATER